MPLFIWVFGKKLISRYDFVRRDDRGQGRSDKS